MLNNINISSGSRSFQNKIFGSITQLSKPSFLYGNKIVSNILFNNKNQEVLAEENVFYAHHALPNELFGVDLNYSSEFGSGSIDIQTLLVTLNNSENTSSRLSDALIDASFKKFGDTNTLNFDAYDDNSPPQCDIP